MGPPTQVREILVALVAQHPVHGDLNEADWLANALEGPIVVHVGRGVRDALELQADLTEVERELVECVLQTRSFDAFRDAMLRRDELFYCLEMSHAQILNVQERRDIVVLLYFRFGLCELDEVLGLVEDELVESVGVFADCHCDIMLTPRFCLLAVLLVHDGTLETLQ